MNYEFIFFTTITVMDLAAALIIFAGALSDRMRLYPAWHKVGLIVAMLGLLVQAFRNIQFLSTGVSPSDADMPLWVLKDAGIATIAFTYLIYGVRHKFFAGAPAPRPPKKVAKRRSK
jgi:hypothetical protein